MKYDRQFPKPLMGKRVAGFVIAMVAAWVANSHVFADATPKSATQGGIQINASFGGGPASTYDLGSFNVSLSNFPYQGSNYGHMLTTFNVNTGANAPPAALFSGMQLHWYQQVQSLPWEDGTTYNGHFVAPWPGSPGTLPMTDPPSGGWDYMYNGVRTPANILPAYSIFVDNEPFYYTRAAETTWVPSSTGQVVSQPGIQYTIEDYPGYRYTPGVSFTDYLVAEATTPNPLDPLGLRPGELMILGGFTWTIALNSSTFLPDLAINSTFAGSPAGAVANMNLGMQNATFAPWNPQTYAGWTAVAANSLTVDVVPLPPAVWTGLSALTVLGVGMLAKRRMARNAEC